MPRSARSRKIAAEVFSARSHMRGLRCCEPTWNESPCATRPERMGALEHARRHLRRAAELARQRPFRAGAVAQDAAEYFRAGRGARELLDLGLAVDRKEADAERIGARDVLLLLDRVAETDPVGRRAGGERLLDLGDRGRVEARAEIGEQAQDLRRRIRLHRVEDARVGQRAGEAEIVLAHDVEIDDEARSVLAVAGEELLDAVRHERHPPRARCSAPGK